MFFERALEEMSYSAEFDLPLILLVIRAKGELDSETTRRLLEALRTAELATLPAPSELAAALQNTNVDGGRAVERRIRKFLPCPPDAPVTFEPG